MHVKLTVTSVLFHPFELGSGVTIAAIFRGLGGGGGALLVQPEHTQAAVARQARNVRRAPKPSPRLVAEDI